MKIKVLFVCMGNICRSPAAQGMFEHLLAEQGLEHIIEVDSAGTHAYHVGEVPDARMQAAAARRGLDLSGQRARRVASEDFALYHYILAMDHSNLAELQERMPGEGTPPVLFMSYAGAVGMDEVPDPYYGGETGFERVLDLVEEAANGLLQSIRRQHSI
jgi:protein-tyrosine phosphatase